MADIMNHTLTKQQKEIVNFNGKELLVRGIAGSGKTLVMLRKAKLTAEKYPDQSAVLFTFSRTLTNAARLIIEKYSLPNLKVMTFHGWATSSYFNITRKKCYIPYNYNNKIAEYFDNAYKTTSKKYKNHRFFKDEKKYKNFLKDEISWIKGKGLDKLEDYINASRNGRGGEIRVSEKDKKILYELYTAYNNEKGYFLDYDDLGLILSKNLNKIKDSDKIDHVFIDEGQDLQKVQLLVLKAIARKSFFIAADKGQKIYKTSFSWSDIGLNVKGGRTKILKESFRSTKQIIQLAASLHKKLKKEDDEYIEPELPTREGPKPSIFKCANKDEQDAAVIQSVKLLLDEFKDITIGILARNDSSLYRIRKSLNHHSILYEIIKRDSGNPFNPGVKLCTLHSSKGLEFDFVIIIDFIDSQLDRMNEDDGEYWEYERRLYYVGMTRPSNYLQIYYYNNPSKILNELDATHYEHKTV